MTTSQPGPPLAADEPVATVATGHGRSGHVADRREAAQPLSLGSKALNPPVSTRPRPAPRSRSQTDKLFSDNHRVPQTSIRLHTRIPARSRFRWLAEPAAVRVMATRAPSARAA
jgi:hypothetical protein